MKNLLYLLFFALLFSCGKDDSNSLAGSYVAKSLKITYDTSPADNVDITFSKVDDCVDAPDGFFGAEEYCRKGKLIINEDNSFSSTIEYIWNLPDINTSTVRFKIKGKGSLSKSEETINLCFDSRDCSEFLSSGNILTYNVDSGSSWHTTVILIKE